MGEGCRRPRRRRRLLLCWQRIWGQVATSQTSRVPAGWERPSLDHSLTAGILGSSQKWRRLGGVIAEGGGGGGEGGRRGSNWGKCGTTAPAGADWSLGKSVGVPPRLVEVGVVGCRPW